MERVLVLLAALAVLSLAFGLLEWRFASVRGQRRFRRAGYFTDIAWWLFTPTVGKLFTGIVVAVSIIGLGAVLGLGITGDHLRGIAERDTFIGRQPLLLQVGAFLLLPDFLAYCSHRAHHTFERLWLRANVGWSYGPLRSVLASPVYHRWHHSNEPEAINKNFAGLFPFWDCVLGTFYLPKDRQPTTFGVVGDAPPAAFLPQLIYPFRSPRRHPAAALESA